MKIFIKYLFLLVFHFIALTELNAQPYTYYSQGSLDPTDPTSWNTARDGSGDSGGLNDFIFDEGNTFIVQATHTMATTQDWHLNGGVILSIENQGILRADNQIHLDAGEFNVLDGGRYIHNNDEFVPWSIFNSSISFFEENLGNGGSTFEIIFPTNKIENAASGFFNIIINSSGIVQTLTDLTIRGVFTITSGSTFNLGTRRITMGSLATTSGTGLLQTQALSTALTANRIWTFNIEYNATSASTQAVIPGSYTNLNTSGSISPQRNRSYSGTINISGTFTPTTATNNVGTSTFVFNAVGNQNIPPFTFNNLTIANAGTKSMTGDITVNATFTISDVAGLLDIGSNNLTLNRNASLTGNLKGSSSSNLTIGGTNGGSPVIKFNPALGDSVLNTLTLTRTGSGAGVTMGSGVAITRLLNITAGVLSLNNQVITLRSTSIMNTAQVATVSGTIDYGTNGLFAIERFIPNTPKNNRGYRDIAPALNTPTGINFFETWQESGSNAIGLGVLITGIAGAAPGGVDPITGLDRTQSGARSLHTQVNGVWSDIVNTRTTKPNVYQGYRVFVRGDRNINLYQVPQATTMNRATTLRSWGQIITGTVTYTTTGVANAALNSSFGLNNNNSNGDYSFLGNPYPAAIDWSTISRTNISGTYTVWDGTIGTQGAYVSWDGITNNNVNSNVNQFIQPGQAFFVQTTAPNPQLVISESNKATSSTLTGVFRTNTINKIGFGISKEVPALGGETNMDGCVVVFYPAASNDVNSSDAAKFANGTENISIFRNNRNISIEHRNLPQLTDTIPLRIWQVQNGAVYTLKVYANEFSSNNLDAYIIDRYTNTETKVDIDTISIPFTTSSSIQASFNNRFFLVFRTKVVLPISKLNLQANYKNTQVEVVWNTEREYQVKKYVVERSSNANSFEALGTVHAKNGIGNKYNFIDFNFLSGFIYYRLKIINADGSFEYSNTILVEIKQLTKDQIMVYPNPVKNKTFTVQLKNIIASEYSIQLFNILGQIVYNQQLQLPTSSISSVLVDLKNTPLNAGNYQLMITSKNGYLQKQKLVIIE